MTPVQIQIAAQPSTSESTSSTLRQLVSRRLAEERVNSNDDESTVSINNSERCQFSGNSDTVTHKQSCAQRERESFSARIKLTTCSICLEHVKQEKPEEIVLTPCGHILHTGCYNRNRAVGVNPNQCPTCKRRIPKLYQLFNA
jgi:histone acetyltransferase (RNA polymerase elongator complex component)